MVKWKLNRKKIKKMDSNGCCDPPNPPLDPPLVRMPLLCGTDIIFLVNYIISMWLKHSFNTRRQQKKIAFKTPGGHSPPRQIPGGGVSHRDRRPSNHTNGTAKIIQIRRGALFSYHQGLVSETQS